MDNTPSNRPWSELRLAQFFVAATRSHFGEVVGIVAAHHQDIVNKKIDLDAATGQPVYVFVFREAARAKDLSDVPPRFGTDTHGIAVRIDFAPK